MENFNPPSGNDPQDAQPTQQFWPGHSAPPGAGFGAGPGSGPAGSGRPPGGPGYGGPGYGSPGYPDPRYGSPASQHWQPPAMATHLAKDKRGARRWAIGVVVAGLLAAGGVTAGLALTGHSTAAGPTGQAAALNAVLSSANSSTAPQVAGTSSSAGTGKAATGPCAAAVKAEKAAKRPRAAQIIRLVCRRRASLRTAMVRTALVHGVHGQFTYSTKKHGLVTEAFERGTVESVAAGQDIVVHAVDGTTWTWHFVSNTVVREGTRKVTTQSVTQGETVWVGGPVVSGSYDARLIVIKPPSSPAPSSTATPSAPAG